MTLDRTSPSTLITGASTGLGREFARAALAAGHGVTITGRHPETLDEAVADLVAADGVTADRVLAIAADASSWDDTRRVMDAHLERFGGLDVAVANAGFTAPGDLATGDPARWESMVLTNVLGPALLTKAADAPLREREGRLVFLGSVAGRVNRPGSLYSATKHAVTALAENVRMQYIGSGVRVTVLNPGVVDTPFWEEGTPPVSVSAAEVAATLSWLLTLPGGVDVNELTIRPVGQVV